MGKLADDLAHDKCIVLERTAAKCIPGLRVVPIGAIVSHKVRITNDCSFSPDTHGKQRVDSTSKLSEKENQNVSVRKPSQKSSITSYV